MTISPTRIVDTAQPFSRHEIDLRYAGKPLFGSIKIDFEGARAGTVMAAIHTLGRKLLTIAGYRYGHGVFLGPVNEFGPRRATELAGCTGPRLNAHRLHVKRMLDLQQFD